MELGLDFRPDDAADAGDALAKAEVLFHPQQPVAAVIIIPHGPAFSVRK